MKTMITFRICYATPSNAYFSNEAPFKEFLIECFTKEFALKVFSDNISNGSILGIEEIRKWKHIKYIGMNW